MKVEKEIKPRTIDIVLASIKKGKCKPVDMIEGMDISTTSLYNALRKLRLEGTVVRNDTKYYYVDGGDNK